MKELEAIAELHEQLAKAYRGLARTTVAPAVFDQHDSPLGPRLHVRLIRRGQMAGYRVQKRYLATREDVFAALERFRVVPAEAEPATLDEDEALLAGIGGKKGRAA
jgi:hypothetical protein